MNKILNMYKREINLILNYYSNIKELLYADLKEGLLGHIQIGLNVIALIIIRLLLLLVIIIISIPMLMVTIFAMFAGLTIIAGVAILIVEYSKYV